MHTMIGEIDNQLKTGKVRQADLLEALEERCGTCPGSLTAAMTQYSADIEGGGDNMLFKAQKAMKPVSTPPYQAVEMNS